MSEPKVHYRMRLTSPVLCGGNRHPGHGSVSTPAVQAVTCRHCLHLLDVAEDARQEALAEMAYNQRRNPGVMEGATDAF